MRTCTLSDTQYRVMYDAATAGTFYVPVGNGVTITTVLGIGRNRLGDLVREVTVTPRTGQRRHAVAGVRLARLGLTLLRDEITRRGDTMPPALAGTCALAAA